MYASVSENTGLFNHGAPFRNFSFKMGFQASSRDFIEWRARL